MNIRLKTEKIYSILELNNTVKGILNRGFPDSIWVHGEIQDYNRKKHNKNVFFQLCQKQLEDDQIIAKVTAVIFERTKKKLAQVLKQAENSFELQDDIEVKFLCKVDLYTKSGGFMLIIESIDPVYTLGKLAQNRQKIITELRKRGILDKNKQAAFPLVPLNIGLITAFDSAAYHDFLDELKRSGFSFKISHFSAYMQGKNVEGDVCSALDIFNEYENIDIVVITRGGGSTADLSWFDNKKIAEKIAFSKVPVLSGIGHEINITITDLAAHTYLKTPTAIAQALINRIKDFLENISEKMEAVEISSKELIQDNNKKLKVITTDIESKTHRFLGKHKERFAGIVNTTQLITLDFIKNSKTNLRSKAKELSMQTDYYVRDIKKDMGRMEEDFAFANFEKKFEFYHENLFEKNKYLKRFSEDIIKNALINIKHYERSINLLDPLNIVKRGFSITKTIEGITVRNIRDVKEKDRLTTIVSDGKIESRVKSTKKE